MEKLEHKNLVKNFLKYVSFDTTAGEEKPDGPSTKKQLNLSYFLMEQLKKYNPTILEINQFGTVHAFFHAKKDKGNAKSICLLSHIDTAPSCKEPTKKPRIIEHYDGSIIKLNETTFLDPKVYTSLDKNICEDLIVTAGDNLLGADDKAGIAIIMELVDTFDYDNNERSLEILFTTDEEIGVDAYHIDCDKLISKFGYTIDGGDINYISNENFNAKSMFVKVLGKNIHPGSAKNKMINSLNVAMDFHMSLPKYERPEFTNNRDGFIHLRSMSGDECETNLEYIIRDFDKNLLESKCHNALLSAKVINEKLGYEAVNVTIKDSYQNMKDAFDNFTIPIDLIVKAFNNMKVPYEFEAIRGGTTGAHLSYMGLPCPNLGTGGYNCHGKYEYVSITQMYKMVDILRELFKIK